MNLGILEEPHVCQHIPHLESDARKMPSHQGKCLIETYLKTLEILIYYSVA